MSFTGVGNDSFTASERGSPADNELVFALSGEQFPVVDIELAPGQGLVCELQSILHIDNAIKFRRWPDLAGEVRLLINPSREQPARLTMRTGCAGRVGVFKLEDYSGRIVCVRQAVLAAGPGVMVGSYSHYRKLRCGDLELVQLEGRGLAFLRSCGEIRHMKLLPGQHRLINSAALTVMTATVDLDPVKVDPETEAADFMRLTGPGQVWLQSGSWPVNCA